MAKEKNILPSFYDMRFLKPLDEGLVNKIFQNYSRIITVEDASLIGGLASAIAELQVKFEYKGQIKSLGIPDQFIEHGSPAELHHICAYDQQAILQAILDFSRTEK
jgi:1-deoxy-D-xylulose-5-phosphate synthase